MLVELSNAGGNYLHDVFVMRLDWWVLLGFVAQAFFTMRFLVQWLASEKAGKSVIPLAFWWFSIGGGLLLLVYALYRRDPVFILRLSPQSAVCLACAKARRGRVAISRRATGAGASSPIGWLRHRRVRAAGRRARRGWVRRSAGPSVARLR